MNANEVIAHVATEKLGADVHPNDHVNMGQSSNDVIPSAIHIAALMDIREQLVPALKVLLDALENKAKEFDHIVKIVLST